MGGRPGWPFNDYADWSPDGTRIAFLERNPKDVAAPYIFVFNADGTGGKMMAYSANSDGPKWSPDGTKLLCGSMVVNADGTGAERIGGGSNPVWSPDQTKIAFASDRALDGSYARNSMNLWVMNANGTDPAPLTDYTSTPGNSWTSFRPKWSPDGTKIIFSSDRALDGGDAPNADFAENIWIINADGSAKMPLTRLTQTDNRNPVWSPSGTKIAFDSTRALDGSDAANTNMATNIWVINADGTGTMPLTKITGFAYNGTPQWHR
jgi:Tol biopolymer transport system component